ncbi:hypothetical protein [Streptomyces sp. NL15-2K]|uniref:hypothetical protein n=1 Tax=Streptomyces sp. NL15-2K TaxID=376149 RepID=UPI000F571602|nr:MULTISPECIES: hypothetical protein [Actinomycetes]WKX09462.1 hypothetical protein Q4V64_19000 [Kutzneria buriramensis]GCB49029.1 hypothetical protein SNL152K_6359 [Streptomyces sp. NL15-2K]
MSALNRQIVHAALNAATVADAEAVQSLVAQSFTDEHRRPVGDKWNNFGLMGSSGSYDLKLIELVTNMQDSVIERFALQQYGSRRDVPFQTPFEAASGLLGYLDSGEQSTLAVTTFEESDPPASNTKRLTAIFRDKGCGMTPASVPNTIFALGGSNKEDALYLQGAFGLGGAMTYRNAKAVVVVSRRDPALLQDDEEDRITVAVVQWQDNTKGQTAYYLVDRAWNTAGDTAEPWSCPHEDYDDFEPGTHLALISYRVDGVQRRREGDAKSFDVVTNTRLFHPVFPTRFVNNTTRGRATTLEGLSYRLERSQYEFERGEEVLPFHHQGQTYQLPVRYWLFAGAPKDPGGRDKFVASEHAVLFTSNGQVHHHRSPRDVRDQTGLNRLYDRLLVVVETDELPIHLRTSLFTADRSELVRGDVALRLEEAVRALIRDSAVLRDANNALIRASYQDKANQPTAEIARKISRALTVKGFSFGTGTGIGGQGGGEASGRAGGGGGSLKPVVLNPDPTGIKGPATVRAVVGTTRSITYTIDVQDSFYDRRGRLRAICEHPDIVEDREITTGKGRNGRVRVMVAIPETAELGTYELRVVLEDWIRAAGGLGHKLEYVTKLELVEEIPGTGTGAGKPTKGAQGQGGPGPGGNVALRWTSHDSEENWDRVTVGAVEDVPASILAEQQSDYAELRALGGQLIPTVLLNQEYPPFKKYLAARNKELTSDKRAREQYAVGVGVSLLLLQRKLDGMKKAGHALPDDDFIDEARRAAANAVLAVMPAFDDLAKEVGLSG